MNGKRAKKLRRMALGLAHQMGHTGGEGRNEYHQAMNCIDWETAYAPDGKVMKDPDGFDLIKPVKKPGTITTAWKFRAIYQNLKRLYKNRRQNHLGGNYDNRKKEKLQRNNQGIY